MAITVHARSRDAHFPGPWLSPSWLNTLQFLSIQSQLVTHRYVYRFLILRAHKPLRQLAFLKGPFQSRNKVIFAGSCRFLQVLATVLATSNIHNLRGGSTSEKVLEPEPNLFMNGSISINSLKSPVGAEEYCTASPI